MKIRYNRLIQWIILFAMILSVLSPDYSDISVSVNSSYAIGIYEDEIE